MNLHNKKMNIFVKASEVGALRADAPNW